MPPVVLLFTRDLRVHDQPALHAAVRRSAEVVPLFVVDPAVLRRSSANRIGYLLDALDDLREALRHRGGELHVRHGDTSAETLRVAAECGADAVYLSADVSLLARRREQRMLAEARRMRIEVRTFPGVTVVPPLEITPTGNGHYAVFTPYWRAWERQVWRPTVPAPDRLNVPAGLEPGTPPETTLVRHGTGELSPDPPTGGEAAARHRMAAWLSEGIAHYEDSSDALDADATSRLSPDLRFGCLSPLELANAARAREGGPSFVRQLAWRDFHHQVTAAFPEIARRDYRHRDVRWRDDEDALHAWRQGRTGIPIVDAGMRQLRTEGFMHNRARLIVASFLTRKLGVHWTKGADHFHSLLLDGDIANNYGNWQWVAGTGNDTRPNRRFNPLRQAQRFDPRGDYVRRYVPELSHLGSAEVHTPWRGERARGEYPTPLVDLDSSPSPGKPASLGAQA